VIPGFVRADKQNRTTTFAVHKVVRTGSLTTYWKLVKFFEYAAAQPEPMIGRADDDVLNADIFAHDRRVLRQKLSLQHALDVVFRFLCFCRLRRLRVGYVGFAGVSQH
jgi:hypothetical protein